MQRTLTAVTLFILLLTALALTHVAAQAPPPTGQWVKDEANPVLGPGSVSEWDSGAVSAPSVLGSDGAFQMWYTGRVATDTAVVAPAIGRAASTDGTEWVKDASNPVLTAGLSGEWDADGVEDAIVLQADGAYHLWYAGHSETGSRRIGYATSPDGVSWTKHADNPVLEPGPEGAWDVRGVRPGAVLWI